MLTTIFGKHTFGAQVALGIMGTALLFAIGRQGFYVGQWLATRLH